MTVEERNYIQEKINKSYIQELPEPMTVECLQAFVKGVEYTYMSFLDAIDEAYRNMKTD